MEATYAVLSRLKLLTPIESEEEGEAAALCARALEDLSRKLADPCDKSHNSLLWAAAGRAFYNLTLKRIMQDPDTGFKAGDLSVTKQPDKLLDLAAKTRDQLLAEAADLLQDDKFLFRSV
jgi:hypothetical protein